MHRFFAASLGQLQSLAVPRRGFRWLNMYKPAALRLLRRICGGIGNFRSRAGWGCFSAASGWQRYEDKALVAEGGLEPHNKRLRAT